MTQTGTIENMGVAYSDSIRRRIINTDELWSNSDSMQDLRNAIAAQHTTQIDMELLHQLKGILSAPKHKTKEERVIDIVKKDFENHFNMTIPEFQAIYENLLENSPEKLI